jgi:high-affinity Fe2+/Pb2+ permease
MTDQWFDPIESQIDRILEFLQDAILALIISGGIAFFIYWWLFEGAGLL